MKRKIRYLITNHEFFVYMYACHRNVNKETLKELSDHFTIMLDFYSLAELSNHIYREGSKAFSEAQEKLPDNEKDCLLYVCKYRGVLLPYCSDDPGQQMFTYYKGKCYTTGAYQPDASMLMDINRLLDEEIFYKVHKEDKDEKLENNN